MNAERLLKLAEFMDKLPAALFDFSIVTAEGLTPLEDALKYGAACGTTACAIGWTPAVFPGEVVWAEHERVGTRRRGIVLPGRTCRDSLDAAGVFFGLTMKETFFLFVPEYSKLDIYALPYEVAAHIRKFVLNHTPPAQVVSQ